MSDFLIIVNYLILLRLYSPCFLLTKCVSPSVPSLLVLTLFVSVSTFELTLRG